MLSTSPAFKQNAHNAMADPGLQKALARTRPQNPAKRAAAVAALPEFEQLRDIGRDIKNHTLAHLDFYLEAWEAKVLESGGHVHWASSADDARDGPIYAAGRRCIGSQVGGSAQPNAHANDRAYD